MTRALYIYVDVDETFVRNFGSKRIPMPNVIQHIKKLKFQGALMYCWSSGGAQYARASAIEFGLLECFIGFLPKPDVMIDDMHIQDWRYLLQVHPNECEVQTMATYRKKLFGDL
jgi:isochorismate hydrolase